MFYPGPSPAWLANCWDTWRHLYFALPGGLPMTPRDCWQLSHGFVGCNLVIDLVKTWEDIFTRAVNPSGLQDDLYAPAVPCDLLYDWLLYAEAFHQQPPDAEPDLLVAAGWRNLPAARGWPRVPVPDPWRTINLCLLRECFVRHLRIARSGPPSQQRVVPQPRAPGARPPQATDAYDFAWQFFTGTETIPQAGPTMPGSCQSRSAAALEAFRGWWTDVSNRVTDYLRAGGWWQGPPDTPTWNVRDLSRILCPTPRNRHCSCIFTTLVQAKSNQWCGCLQAHLNALPGLPAPGGVSFGDAYAEDGFSRREHLHLPGPSATPAVLRSQPFHDWVQDALAGVGPLAW